MSLFSPNVKLGSRHAVLSVLGAVGLTLGLTACVIVQDDPAPPITDPGYGNYSGVPYLATIDADEKLVQDPGKGVGLIVEYGSEGHWRVWTVCDSFVSGLACAFDVCVSAPNHPFSIGRVDGEGLEGDDIVYGYDDGTVCMSTLTDYDLDTMTFDTPPGETLRLEMALDGASRPEFVFWVGDGIVHAGAPSNPLDLQPNTP